MSFPDHGDMEEIIREVGNAELLYKAGKKILRFNKSTWGKEDNEEKYALLESFATGRILDVGLGMGISVDVLLGESVTEMICYEIEENLVEMYQLEGEKSSSEKLSIINEDAWENKPEGEFDLVLYEIQVSNQALYDNALSYVEWALEHSTRVIIEDNVYTRMMINEIDANPMYISSGSGLGEKRRWIVWTSS